MQRDSFGIEQGLDDYEDLMSATTPRVICLAGADMSDVENKTCVALEWAIQNTCLALPEKLRAPSGWLWDDEDLQFRAQTDDGEFRFHVAGERRGLTYFRIAVMSWKDYGGYAKWESDILLHQTESGWKAETP